MLARYCACSASEFLVLLSIDQMDLSFFVLLSIDYMNIAML